MGFLESLIAWANLPFTAAIATVVTFALLQASGLLGLLAGGEVDHDADSDFDGDVDTDGDLDADHDINGDHNADHADAKSAASGLLATVGVGKLPTSIIWQTFAMTFGMTGVVTNTLVFGVSKDLSAGALLLSLPVALVGGFGFTSLIAKALTKMVKPPQEAPGKRHLVGLVGVVVSGKVDEEFGEVRVKGPHGELVQLHCRVMPGEKALANQAQVVIVSYDRERDCIYVMPANGDSSGQLSAAVRVRS